MRIACVSQDAGIAPGRSKGAAVHLAEVRLALAELGAQVLPIDEPEPESALRALEAVRAAGGLDLVYERHALGRAAVARRARELDVPHVLEVNAPLLHEEVRWRGRSVAPERAQEERELFRSTERVFAVSEAVAEYAIEQGAEPERVEVRANAVDPAVFQPRRSGDPVRARYAQADELVIGFHGRLRPWHGLDLVARAVARLAQEGRPVRLLTVGHGEFEACCAPHLSSELHAHVPWATRESIGSLVAAFDVLPLGYPPEGAHWFSPLKLSEAMACEAVPVVPRVGELPQRVRHEETGLVYATGELDALCGALRRLVLEPGLRAKLGAAAREAATAYTWRDYAGEVLALGARCRG